MKTEYLIFAAIFGWSIGSLFYKPANDNIHPIMVSTVVTIVYLALTPLAFMFLKFDHTLNAPGVMYAVLAGLFTCLGSMGYFYALKTGGAGEITALTSLYPAFTLLLSWIFLGEHLSIRKAVGIAFAFASIAIISWK